MVDDALLNLDLAQRVAVDTAAAAWQPSPSAGVWRKPLEREAAEHGRTTSLVRFAPGSSFAPHSHPRGEEILVLEGVFSDDAGDYPAGTYLQPWLPGQGRLEVMPLHSHLGEHVALVRWPAGERFVPHRHFGGEEIYVLSGTFRDEFGSYPAGSWLRSPHLSRHHPFVDEETVIWVKVGHLPHTG